MMQSTSSCELQKQLPSNHFFLGTDLGMGVVNNPYTMAVVHNHTWTLKSP
jgi:hypothetical protein